MKYSTSVVEGEVLHKFKYSHYGFATKDDDLAKHIIEKGIKEYFIENVIPKFK